MSRKMLSTRPPPAPRVSKAACASGATCARSRYGSLAAIAFHLLRAGESGEPGPARGSARGRMMARGPEAVKAPGPPRGRSQDGEVEHLLLDQQGGATLPFDRKLEEVARSGAGTPRALRAPGVPEQTVQAVARRCLVPGAGGGPVGVERVGAEELRPLAGEERRRVEDVHAGEPRPHEHRRP